jgi:hypothetical protein
MAGTITYLTLTNKLLRRLNEVEISQSDFPSVRGVQLVAKDAINASVQKIVQSEIKWPFNAQHKVQVLTVGTNTYPNWPTDLVLVEWDSFTMAPDINLGVYGHPLEFVSRDWYLKYRKSEDDNHTVDGADQPYAVYENPPSGYGITPVPNQAFTISYDYWAGHTALVNYDDVSNIPDNYEETIIQGGLYHMFRDNTTQADAASTQLKDQIQHMRTALINKEDRIRSPQVPQRRRILTYSAKLE